MWGKAALQVTEERGMFSLELLQREVLLSAFGAGREKGGLRKSEGERELPSALQYTRHGPQVQTEGV